MKSGAHLKILEGHRGSIGRLTLSHDTTRLASASKDETVKIWDISTGTCLQTLKHRDFDISELVFSDGLTQLKSVSVEEITNIWDISSGTRLQSLRTCNFGPLTNVFTLPHSKGSVKGQPITHCSINISADRTSITRHDKEWLWLPAEYQPSHFAISGGCIVVTTDSGRTWSCHFV